MRTTPETDSVIFDIVADARQFLSRALRSAQSGQEAQAARISFPTPEAMLRMLSERRLAILRALCGAGPIGVRELAQRVGRDVRAVHADAHALLQAGILDKSENSKLLFPWGHIRVEFVLDATQAPDPAAEARCADAACA